MEKLKISKSEVAEVLNEGGILCNNTNEDRFYKLIDDVLMYSDDLKEWKKSSSSIDKLSSSDLDKYKLMQ